MIYYVFLFNSGENLKTSKFLNIFFIALILMGYSIPSFSADLPENYSQMKACEQQNELWNRIVETQHEITPDMSNLGLIQLLAMSFQKLRKKSDYISDVAPKGWKKYLHRRGAVAKVQFVATENHDYTGVFKGAECALLRLSLTYEPKKDKAVAPGLALKVLRDQSPSANVSALYALDGQERDFNFFKNPLSHIVPRGQSVGEKLVHKLFKRVSWYPEVLLIDDFGVIDAKGTHIESPKTPFQIFFVPNPNIEFSSQEHDVRESFLTIEQGTTLFEVYALSEAPKKDYHYDNYTKSDIAKFVAKANKIGEIITTSSFIVSEFGDSRLFFRHEIHRKE